MWLRNLNTKCPYGHRWPLSLVGVIDFNWAAVKVRPAGGGESDNLVNGQHEENSEIRGVIYRIYPNIKNSVTFTCSCDKCWFQLTWQALGCANHACNCRNHICIGIWSHVCHIPLLFKFPLKIWGLGYKLKSDQVQICKLVICEAPPSLRKWERMINLGEVYKV